MKMKHHLVTINRLLLIEFIKGYIKENYVEIGNKVFLTNSRFYFNIYNGSSDYLEHFFNTTEMNKNVLFLDREKILNERPLDLIIYNIKLLNKYLLELSTEFVDIVGTLHEFYVRSSIKHNKVHKVRYIQRQIVKAEIMWITDEMID